MDKADEERLIHTAGSQLWAKAAEEKTNVAIYKEIKAQPSVLRKKIQSFTLQMQHCGANTGFLQSFPTLPKSKTLHAENHLRLHLNSETGIQSSE